MWQQFHRRRRTRNWKRPHPLKETADTPPQAEPLREAPADAAEPAPPAPEQDEVVDAPIQEAPIADAAPAAFVPEAAPATALEQAASPSDDEALEATLALENVQPVETCEPELAPFTLAYQCTAPAVPLGFTLVSTAQAQLKRADYCHSPARYPFDRCARDRAMRLAARLDAIRQVAHPWLVGAPALGLTPTGIAWAEDHGDWPSVADYARGHTPLSLADAVAIGRSLAQALLALREVGIFHRQLRPETILFDPAAQRVCLRGCELAVRLAPGQQIHSVTGAFPYVAPEVVNSTADCRADLFRRRRRALRAGTGDADLSNDQCRGDRQTIGRRVDLCTLYPAAQCSARAVRALIVRAREKPGGA